MDAAPSPEIGTLVWTDLTVADAESIRDFYSAVIGWSYGAVEMKGYNDYQMNNPGTGDAVAGICHARGVNTGLPAQWLLYFRVADIEESIAQCVQHGGTLQVPPKAMGAYGRFCVIQDPAGAVVALIQPPDSH
jgi:uncharacterized protein